MTHPTCHHVMPKEGPQTEIENRRYARYSSSVTYLAIGLRREVWWAESGATALYPRSGDWPPAGLPFPRWRRLGRRGGHQCGEGKLRPGFLAILCQLRYEKEYLQR